MKDIFRPSTTDTDMSEVVDPHAPTGLNRKTIAIIGLALACMVTSIIIASSGGGSSNEITMTALAPDEDPTYGGVFSLPSSQFIEQAEPEPTPTDMPPAWAAPLDAGQVNPYAPGEDVTNTPLGRYQSAVRSGGLFFEAQETDIAQTAPPTNPNQVTMTGDRTVVEGTTIPAVLEHAINSDRPGPVKARVLHDVTDSKTLTQVLIPAGTQVVGAMDMAGFSIALTWHRLIFPDGRSMNVDQLPSIDTGGGGVAGNVDRHRLARFGRAVMSTLIGATTTLGGAQLSEYGGVVGGAVALQLGQGASTMQQFTRAPTVTVPVGHRFDIWVQSDLQF